MEAMPDTPIPPPASGAGSVRPSILVVDDTPDNLSLMSELLLERYHVRVANSGERALRIAQSAAPPDLILLDIMMPHMDGYEVCQRLKENAATRAIPVIFLTAKVSAEDEERGLSLGAVDYVTKPISAPIVLARIQTHLSLKAASDFLRDQNVYLESEVQKRTRELSANTVGMSPVISVSRRSSLRAASEAIRLTASPISAAGSKAWGSNSIRSASSLEKSRMSFTAASSDRPPVTILSA